MVFYIWQSGGLVEEVTEALIQAAKRGVKCRIMVDSAGSRSFFRTNGPCRMRAAGIEFTSSHYKSICSVSSCVVWTYVSIVK